jgi:hypothetical protein
MHQIGTRFDQNQKTYYTDNHESPSNVIYRDVYIKEHLLLSLRQPVWTYVQKDEVSQEALNDLNNRMIVPKIEIVMGWKCIGFILIS